MGEASQPVGTLEVALGHARELLAKDAGLAAEQAREILKAAPGPRTLGIKFSQRF